MLSKSVRRWIGLAFGLVGSASVWAEAGYYVVTPYSTPGQLSVDLRYWTVDSRDRDAVLWPEAGLRYGVTSRWTTELFVSFIGPTLRQQGVDSWNWQNDWLLTQGQYSFDLALHTQLIHEPDEGNLIEFGPVWQTEFGRLQINANLFFERALSEPDGTEAKYQWQVLGRLRPGVRWGVQGFGELGRLGHSEDPHSDRLGPVLKLGLGEKAQLQAAYLWGRVYGRRAEMFSAQFLYSF
ncbi:hypothetical protein [Piscinibacter terrae]|uniref:hypothetical protein n=1 Tax=Piscinibacter terrae TaxID=2496871 RepID=UPI001F299672|nr:hypothetical protein [Albitalea terrae]